MKKIIIGVAVAIVALVAWALLTSPSPKYQGKSVEEWFYQYYTSGSYGIGAQGDHEEATLALKVLQTNSVPYLMSVARNPPRDTIMSKFAYFMRRLFQHGTMGPYISGKTIGQQAEFAVRRIQPSANIILPAVTNWLSNPKDKKYRAALFYLGCIGDGAEQGLPFLAEVLTNSSNNALDRGLAAQSLLWLGPKAKGALPAMIASLNTSNVSANVYKAIGSFGPGAREALPLLDKKLTQNTNVLYRMCIVAAICSIDTNRTDALEELAGYIRADRLRRDLSPVLYAMRDVGPAARITAPLVADIARSTNTAVSGTALSTLETISPEHAVTVLREKLTSTEPSKAIWAAGGLLRINAKDSGALAYLTNFVKTPDQESTWDYYALEQMGNSAPDDRLIKLLEDYAAKGSPRTRPIAQQSLKRIRLKQSGSP